MSAVAYLLLSLLGTSTALPQLLTTNGLGTGFVAPGNFGAFGQPALIGLGRTQVLANQRFGFNQRTALEVVQGGLVCTDGFSGRQFLLRPGQVITFRGGNEFCQAQVASIVLAQIV